MIFLTKHVKDNADAPDFRVKVVALVVYFLRSVEVFGARYIFDFG
jgi:hypothetical protein